jgi:drug/metabolite transporter (DMT)-like permease
MSIILAYIFYFVAASASPLQRRWLAKHKNAENTGQIAFAFHVSIITVILSLVLPLFEPFKIVGSVFVLIVGSLCCGLFGALYFILSYTAQKHVEAGVSSVVSNIYTPITILLATVFLHESLTGIQIFGTALLLVAVLIVSQKHRTGKFTFDKYFVMMLLSGVSLGVLLIFERYLQKVTGFTAGTILSWWSQCIFLGLIMLSTKSKHTYTRKDIAITGGLRFLQSLSWVVLIFVVGNLSIVSSVTTFKVVIVFIAGALFLGEKDDLKRKIIGSIIAVIGLLLMK